MKSFCLLSTFLFIVLFCAQTNGNKEEEFSCEPNKEFKINCNSCLCSETGTWAQCDIEYCDPIDSSKYMKVPTDCKEDWFDGCNYHDCHGIGQKIGCSRRIGANQDWF